MLLLDYNKERSIHSKGKKANGSTLNDHINLEDAPDEDDQEARIFIHTLRRYSAYGGGAYTMNSLKKISPTEDFLRLPFTTKDCTIDDEHDCNMKKYLEKGRQECGCVPWEFPDATTAKISLCQIFPFPFLLSMIPLIN